MDYLYQVLGIRTEFLDGHSGFEQPNHIRSNYRLQSVALDGRPVIFVYPNTEMLPVNLVKKHLEIIRKTANKPAVLVPERLTSRQKAYLLREHIPFIVTGRQIYLPFMAVYLQESGEGASQSLTEMLPSAQLLLLYCIYHGCRNFQVSEAARELGFTPMSMSRASRQLKEMNLVRTEKIGVHKIIFSEKSPRELFSSAKALMKSPVKRTVYVSKSEIHGKETFLLSGYSALSEYSMINPSHVECFATDSIASLGAFVSMKLQNSDDQCALELWCYDPKRLSSGDCVDRLSLALSLSNEKDERVQEAVEQMLDEVWREIKC